ncbi:MAG: hypothetical protein LKI94_08665 [Sporolactobacillus sp.]|jgi:hypothetical protein|nr:hypothetical protein [Sporolactobacillus sp.]
MKGKQRFFLKVGSIIALFFLFLFAPLSASAASDGQLISDDEIQTAYTTGKDKGIITNENMTYSEFTALCKNSVIPAYQQYSKQNPTVTFQQYIADDHYEVPEQQPGDHPTEVQANDSTKSSGNTMQPLTSAKSGYNMKAGDILVIYGINSDSSGKFIGHAAIASSSKYVLHMPGYFHYAEHWTKKHFFQHYTSSHSYVAVYRIKKHPHYSNDAASYAYHKMYKKSNPWYSITTRLYHKSPSYCSKYVYLSYWWGATHSALIYYKKAHIVTPHGLVGNFKGTFKPSYIHKITKY